MSRFWSRHTAAIRKSLKVLGLALALIIATADRTQAAPLGIADVPWPTIHQDSRGQKNSPLPAPVPGNISAEYFATTNVGINQLQGRKYFYFQEMNTGIVRGYDLNQSTNPLFEFDLGPTYPLSGGGVIDSNNRLWWTNSQHLIRLDEDLSHPVYSEPLPNASAWNGTTLLPDGNMLVTSMLPYAGIVSTQINKGSFPLTSYLNRSELTWRGEKIFKKQALFKSRPISDGKGTLYFVAGRYLVRWSFDALTHTMRSSLDWAYQLPADDTGEFEASNPIRVGNAVCANTMPDESKSSTVYCVDESTGKFTFRNIPFPEALGNPGLHNLSASPGKKLLLVNISDANQQGGLAAIDLSSGKTVWRNQLENLSHASAVSDYSGFIYVSDKPLGSDSIRYLAIDLATGSVSVLLSKPSAEIPANTLWAIGKDGDLLAPFENGFFRILNF